MRAECAGFGEVNGGHALLGYSEVERSRYSEIISKTDKPAYAPPGIIWSPYISGFPVRNDYYVMMKTFPDSSASRSGMVFSYALLFKLEELTGRSDLGKLIDLLPTTLLKPTEYKSIEIPPEMSPDIYSFDRRLAECLTSAQPGESVVWLGEERFADAIVGLWACMWPEMRGEFSFRLAFDPQDLDVDRPTIVLTPSQLESRWGNYPIVQRSTRTATVAGAALAREPEGEALRALKQSITARIIHPRELRLLEQVYSTLSAELISTAQGRSALHLIGRLCPATASGQAEKSQLLQLTATAVSAETDAAEIRAFRNLGFAPFQDPQVLLLAIETWVSVNILRDATDSAAASLLLLAFDNTHYLSDRIRKGLSMSLQGQKAKNRSVLWVWIKTLSNDAPGLMSMAVSSGWDDASIAGSCPAQIDKSIGNALLPLVRELGLLLSHSAIAAAALDPEEAIRSHLELGILPSHPASLVLIERIGVAAVVHFAIGNSDNRGTLLGVEALRKDAFLLQPVRFDNANWVRLFTSAVRAKIQISQLLSATNSDAFKAFDFVLGGGDLDASIWEALSESEFSNIADYAQRTLLWAYIPAALRERFLLRTAEAWLDSFSSNLNSPHAVEPELESTVESRIRGRSFDVPTLIRLCYQFSSLDEDLFISALQQSLAKKKAALTFTSSELLGLLVAEKQWVRAANHLFGWSDRHNDLLPAVAKCLNLLNRWQRLRAIWLKNVNNVAHPTTEDLWTALEELGIELYSWGPGDRDIWERAGGDRASIRVHTTGRESWHDVINQARRGGAGSVSVRSLVAAMREDYAWNDVLARVSQHLGI